MLEQCCGISQFNDTYSIDVVEVLKSIEKYKATVFSDVTTLYTALLNHPDTRKFNLTSLNCCICGAKWLPPEIQKQFMDLTGSTLVDDYYFIQTPPDASTDIMTCGKT